MIETANGYLDRATQSDFVPTAKELLSEAEQLANSAYLLFQKMAGSQAEDIPHQIVRPFQRWANGLGIRNDLLFRAQYVVNYELSTINLQADLRNINGATPALKAAARDIAWPLLRVTVPSQALGMFPHFAVVAHELGHAIETDILNRLDLAERTEIQDSGDRVRKRLETLGREYGSSVQIKQQKIIARWLNEIIADAVGLCLAGPAYYFALTAFLELSFHGLGMGPAHPPSKIRQRLLLNQLNAGGDESLAAVFKKYAGIAIEEDTASPNLTPLPDGDELFNLLRERRDSRSAEDSAAIGMDDISIAIYVELIPLMEELWVHVYQAVSTRLSGAARSLLYTPDRLRDDLEYHLNALLALVPPIERRPGKDDPTAEPEPVSLESILNIGWAALLGKLHLIPVAEPDAPHSARLRLERLHELLLKAVELSEARRSWTEERDSKG